MLCGNCGNEMDEHALFCPECGAKNPALTSQNDPDADAVNNESIPSFDAEDQSQYAPTERFIENDNNQPQPDDDPNGGYNGFALNTEGNAVVKKKKSKWPILIICLTLLAAAAACIVIFWSNITGFFKNTFTEPEKLQEDAVENAITNVFEGEFDPIEALKEMNFDSMGYYGDIQLEADATVMGLLSNISPYDLTWFQNAKIKYDASLAESYARVNYDISLNDTQIGEIEQIMNLKNQEQWISAPDFYKGVYHVPPFDEDTLMLEGSMLVPFISPYDELQNMKQIINALPTRDQVMNILLRYTSAAMGCFTSVEKENKTVEIQGISQNLLVLTSTMDADEGIAMNIQLRQMLLEDQEIQDIIRSLGAAMGQEDLYDEFVASIESEIEEYKQIQERRAAGDMSDDIDGTLIMTTYLNGKSNIVGIDLKFQDAEVEENPLRFVMVQSGHKFGLEFVINDGFEETKIQGTGSVQDKKVSGSFDVEMDGEKLVNLELVDCHSTESKLEGTIRVRPYDATMQMFVGMEGAEVAGLLSAAELYVEVEFSISAETNSMRLSLISGKMMDKVMLSIYVSATKKDSDTITVPVEGLFEEMSIVQATKAITTLVERLTEAGVPEEILIAIMESAVDSSIGI